MGPLLIVGGADKIYQTDIYNAFLDNCLHSGTEPPLIAVMATAASDPEAAFRSIEEKLFHAGPCRPVPVPLSLFKKEWEKGAFRSETISLIEQAGGIWFTGGDQNQTMAALTEEDGTETPLLSAIRRRNKEGAIIGGTSAGAAVMSDPMISGGSPAASLFTLYGESCSEEDVTLAKGLGFLPDYIVDQHFDRRSRMGRLIAALHKRGRPLGLGIGENTALLVKDKDFSVFGSGPVYLVEKQRNRIILSLFEKGDHFDPRTGRGDFGEKREIGNNTVLQSPYPVATGVFSPYPDLRNFLARQLMDNDAACLKEDRERGSHYVSSYLFDPSLFPRRNPVPALELRFHKIEGQSRAYCDKKGGFTLTGIGLEIIPLSLRLGET